MNGTSLMNVSDGCPTLTCLSLKLRRCYLIDVLPITLSLFSLTYPLAKNVPDEKILFRDIPIGVSDNGLLSFLCIQ